MPVTIKDIAQKLGLSHPTVSRALHDKPPISKETCNLVKKVAFELGYKPNLVSRSLKIGKTKTIGLVTGDKYSFIETASRTFGAAEKMAITFGYRCFACDHGGELEREIEAIDELLTRRVDGFIVWPIERTDGTHFLPYLEKKVPMVLVNRDYSFPANSVMVNNVEGGMLAVRHLLELGRSDIAFVVPGTAAHSKQDRMKGWRQGCREGGLDFDAMPFVGTEIDSSTEAIEELVRTLLASGRRFNGLVCSNDIVAAISLKLLQESGLRVPEDVAIVGFDDITLARFLTVPLTTVRQPVELQGELAFKRLLKQIEDPSAPPEKVLLKPELIVRNSTVGPRQRARAVE